MSWHYAIPGIFFVRTTLTSAELAVRFKPAFDIQWNFMHVIKYAHSGVAIGCGKWDLEWPSWPRRSHRVIEEGFYSSSSSLEAMYFFFSSPLCGPHILADNWRVVITGFMCSRNWDLTKNCLNWKCVCVFFHIHTLCESYKRNKTQQSELLL